MLRYKMNDNTRMEYEEIKMQLSKANKYSKLKYAVENQIKEW